MYEAQAAQNLDINSPTPAKTKTKCSPLDALKRIRAPGRPRAQSYRTLDGRSAGRDAVAWYWRLVGIASSFMILGGFLMLPATFERDPTMRVSQAVVGIFAVALLAAGFSFTALLCFAVRNPLFQADNVFLPAFTSCALGLLTVLYNFLIFNRYYWNTPALLVSTTAAVSTIVYGGLLVWTQRKLKVVKTRIQQHDPPVRMMQMGTFNRAAESSQTALTQEQTYYANYNQNMFPAAYNRGPPNVPPNGYDPESITEEEMQRQQMLMLLLNREQASMNSDSAAASSSSTYQIDWQGREDDEVAATPSNGWYPPPPLSSSVTPSSAYPHTAYPFPGITRQNTEEMRPWDGVWREVRRPSSRDSREARRREIEGQMS